MKTAVTLLTVALGLASAAACAQNTSVGTSPSSLKSLDTYAEPGGSPGGAVPVSELAMPLTIIESQSGYHKVRIDGQPVWVKSAQVRIKRASKASCAGTDELRAANEQVGATAGITRNDCK
jgi:hypothetical protein